MLKGRQHAHRAAIGAQQRRRAGQGGFGIQTAPAAAKMAAALLTGDPLDPMLKGVKSSRYSPARFG